MTKKIRLISLFLVIAFFLTACGNNGNSSKQSPEESVPAENTINDSPNEELPQENSNSAKEQPVAGNASETNKVNPYDYYDISDFNGSGLAPVCQKSDNCWGYIDTAARLVVPCTYFWADKFSGGMAAVAIRNEKYNPVYGFIDTTGELVIPCIYDSIYHFSDDGYAVVKKDNKYGLIDRKGNIIIPFEYFSLVYYDSGICCAAFKGELAKTGDYEYMKAADLRLINLENQPISDENYSLIWRLYVNGKQDARSPIYAEKDDRKAIISRSGKIIEPYDSYDSCHLLSDNSVHIILVKNNLKGVLNYSSEAIVLPFEYPEILFDEGTQGYRIKDTNGKWGYCDQNGNILISPQFDGMGAFSEGLAAVRINKEWGYIGYSGNIVIESQFESHAPFTEGLASFYSKSDKAYGYIDKTGEVVLEPVYYSAASFSEGLAFVTIERHDPKTGYQYDYQYIDHDGNPVFSNIVRGSIKDHDDWLMFKGGIAYGRSLDFDNIMFNTKGEVLITNFDSLESARYDPEIGFGVITRYENGYGHSWLVNQNGEFVVPFVSEHILEEFPEDGYICGVDSTTDEEYIFIYDTNGNRIL